MLRSSSRSGRIRHEICLDMIGLFEITRLPVFGCNDMTNERLVGIWESVEDCLHYMYQPDNGPYVYSTRKLTDNIDESYHLGYQICYLHANSTYKKELFTIKSQEELVERMRKLLGTDREYLLTAL